MEPLKVDALASGPVIGRRPRVVTAVGRDGSL
jgi:hypothetical protein